MSAQYKKIRPTALYRQIYALSAELETISRQHNHGHYNPRPGHEPESMRSFQ
ncbi:hypothetical protein [Arthrobacter sp. 2MCAF14]|uniref:hypothetical protein n=1 Tax=Arthrobacter sp. 2MCAF14 TaxID=3232982 RepID=UPI003F926478